MNMIAIKDFDTYVVHGRLVMNVEPGKMEAFPKGYCIIVWKGRSSHFNHPFDCNTCKSEIKGMSCATCRFQVKMISPTELHLQ